MTTKEAYEARIARVSTAIALECPDRVPIAPMVSALPYFLSEDTAWKDSMYNYPKAAQAVYSYYRDFMPDAFNGPAFTSGRSNEIAGSTMIDWPGRPGTRVPDWSTHQCFEFEYLREDEYPELLRDYTGFMLRKYIPRAFPGLKGLESVNIVPSIVLSTAPLAGLYSAGALEAYKKLEEIGANDGAANEAFGQMLTALREELGLPPMWATFGEVPFDILSDYYRGTMGTFEDLAEQPENIAAACDLFADIQIAHFRSLKESDLPVRRINFPMHKGMDGFMSPSQYETLYWKPMRKVIDALLEMNITPILYTEGPYDTRVEQLCDLPRGKVLVHFEQADMARAKKILGNTCCLTGGFPVFLLEYGTKEQVADEAKRLLDTCAADGGYILDTDCCIENVKRENLEVLFDTVRTYGVY